jgi:hypothetical protein
MAAWPPDAREAEIGMLVVETIAKIRRAYFVQQKPIKEICRDLHVFAEGRAQGHPFGRDGVPLRT